MTVAPTIAHESNQDHGSLIFDSSELLYHPCLTRVQRMINLAFWRDDGVAVNSDGKKGRFEAPEDIIPMVGKHGRMVVLFRHKEINRNDHGGQKRELDFNEPVAVAVMKYFKPDLGIQPMEGELDGDVENGIGYDSEPEDILSIKHWEPACVSILPFDKSLQGKGLATRCVRLLEDDLLRRIDAAAQQQEKKTGQPRDTAPLTFWIRAKTDSTEDYWKRRGYERLSCKWYAKGCWGYDYDFQISVLTKLVPKLRRDVQN